MELQHKEITPVTATSPSAAHGFTLLEIVIAIALLAVALVSMIGLNSSAMERTIRDRHAQQAMLLSRSILAGIEASKQPIEVGQTSGTALELVRQFNAAPDGADFPPELDIFTASLEVESISIPINRDGAVTIANDALRRINLEIRWGDGPDQVFPVVFFVPTQ